METFDPDPPTFEEDDERVGDDYHWACFNPVVRERFGGRVVAVFRRKVWGVGADDGEAMADAQSKFDLPNEGPLMCVNVPTHPWSWEGWPSVPDRLLGRPPEGS